MPTFVRQTYVVSAACMRKKRFSMYCDALAECLKLRRKPSYGPRLGVYRCDECDGWHLGKSKWRR